MLGEHSADRLDTPSEATISTVFVLLDERDYRRCGRSSSAAKKAEAAFNISFARRNSAFSRFNRLISTAASVLHGCVGTWFTCRASDLVAGLFGPSALAASSIAVVRPLFAAAP